MSELPLGPLLVDIQGLELGPGEAEFLRAPAVGGVILFSRNYQSHAQVRVLIDSIKSLRSPELLIAVDQEGGRVQRFRHGFYRLPAVNGFGKLFDSDPQLARTCCRNAGQLMAAELIAVGVDFSFAPVLDCANPRSEVIGDRGFHHQPTVICELAGAFIDGMNRAGMSATGKHFPGHGGINQDSHLELPVDGRNLRQLNAWDLVPFAKLAPQLRGMMTAHVRYPEIDHQLPGFSPFWIEHVLRRQLGFTGVVFSDDLSMAGARVGGTIEQRTRLALEAGCDMVLICNDRQSARSAVQAIGDGFTPDAVRLQSMYGNPVSADLSDQNLAGLAKSLQVLEHA